HVGARTGIERRHLDGWVVDLGERRDRERPVADHAREQNREHEQPRCDGALDEDRGRVHEVIRTGAAGGCADGAALDAVWCRCGRCPGGGAGVAGEAAPRALSAISATCAPSRSLSSPSITTFSPARTPSFTETRSPLEGPALILRRLTVLSAFTTYTKV